MLGIGLRELAIFGGAITIGLLLVLMVKAPVLRVGIGVFFLCVAAALALGRVPGSGLTLEQYLFQYIKYKTRSRVYLRDGGKPDFEQVLFEEVIEPNKDKAPQKGLFKVRAIPLKSGLLFTIISLSFLSMLIAWLWVGGLEEVLPQAPHGF